jgi:murein L,D-transpeptidase YafK
MARTSLIPILALLLPLMGCSSDEIPEGAVLPLADYILVEKGKRKLSLYKQDELLRSYNIAIGKATEGHKEREGDHKTPEGVYKIIKKNPKSRYHRALKISYPNKTDIDNASKRGLKPGGDIMIHGMEPSYWWVTPKHKLQDLTRGCIVVTNSEIEEIYESTPVDTTVEIKP